MTISSDAHLSITEKAVRSLLILVGEDPDREGLKDTPTRFEKAWRYWTSGYERKPSDVLKCFQDGGEDYDEFVVQREIPVWSLCEHHLAPFFGVAHVGYIPAGRVVGLSKLSRLVDIFARRLQVQERLTVQIADALHQHLHPKGVGVLLECRHTCMESRGVEKAGTITTTSAVRGSVRTDQAARNEFLEILRGRRR